MQKYRCIKVVEAEPQKLTEEMAKRFEGTSSKVGDDGYKVRYEDGYESWSPKEAFEEGYISLETNYKDRMFIEYCDLSKKIDKLECFINSDKINDLSVDKINLLALQLDTMKHYRYILRMRLNLEGVSVIDVNDEK